MIIETKFKPGDTVFYLKDNKVQSFVVKRVNVYMHEGGVIDIVVCSDCAIEEKLCFATKEELLASL